MCSSVFREVTVIPKGKIHHRTGNEVPELEERHSFTLSFTSVLDGLGGQHQATTDLFPGMTRYQLHRRLGGLQGRSGRVRKISSTPGLEPRTIHHVVSRYKD